MDWLLHLVHNDHGEWNALVAFFSNDPSVLWRWATARVPPPRWRVYRQKVTPPFFNPQRVETIIYGPYRAKVVAILVGYLVCGEWDRCDIQERK